MYNPDTERAIATLTKEFLIEEHITKRIPVCKIAKDNHFARVTVLKYLKKFNIPSESLESILTKEVLEEHYIKRNLNSKEVADIFKCASSVVRSYLRKHNIPLKSLGEVKKGVRSKEKCHLWKGGITPLHVKIRNTIENRVWIKEVFKRDSYICQECGKKGGKLAAHHIKEFNILFKEFLQEYSQFSPIEDKETLLRLAVSYKPFWNIANGKTLCCKCHEKTYKKEK